MPAWTEHGFCSCTREQGQVNTGLGWTAGESPGCVARTPCRAAELRLCSASTLRVTSVLPKRPRARAMMSAAARRTGPGGRVTHIYDTSGATPGAHAQACVGKGMLERRHQSEARPNGGCLAPTALHAREIADRNSQIPRCSCHVIVRGGRLPAPPEYWNAPPLGGRDGPAGMPPSPQETLANPST